MSSVVISGNTSGAITLSAPDVSGTNTATLPAATGTVMVSGNMPAFRVYKAAGQQVISTGTYTKVQFNGETFDTNNCFDSTTNYRFTPTVAGYYQLQSFVQMDGFTGTGYIEIDIYKNGAAISFSNTTPNSPTYPTTSIVDTLYANGTTDYFEIYVFQNSGSNKNIYGGAAPAYVWFSGSMVRSA